VLFQNDKEPPTYLVGGTMGAVAHLRLFNAGVTAA